jgi:hypothetical protein
MMIYCLLFSLLLFYNLCFVKALLKPWTFDTKLSSTLPEGVSIYSSQVVGYPELGAWLAIADISLIDKTWYFGSFVSKKAPSYLQTVHQCL